ncbi:hypothetical protein Y045_5584 [Burkholderia pseudomallei MSHR2451]|nr:hypothetical protein Y045_5584 [Burkholderia pseudomallei MSHR2451]
MFDYTRLDSTTLDDTVKDLLCLMAPHSTTIWIAARNPETSFVGFVQILE